MAKRKVVKPSREIAKREEAPAEMVRAGQESLPAFMKGQAGRGTEALAPSDVEIPRLKLLQALSPELTEFEGIKQGEFFHTIAEEGLGDELVIVPVYVDQSFILWRPRKMGGGILARAADGVHWSPPNASFDVVLDSGKKATWKTAPTVLASRLADWGSMDPSDTNSPPAATRMYNIVAMLPNADPAFSPVVITLQRAAIRVARKLMGKMKISQAPSYGTLYTMSSREDQNPQGQKYWNYAFTASGLVTDEREFTSYKEMYERFREAGIRIRDINKLQEEELPQGAPEPRGETTKF